MSPAATAKASQAFTLIELLLMIVIVLVLFITAMPMHKGVKVRDTQVQCTHNLRQVSLSYILWSSDNTNLFPWEVSTNAGGSLELIERGIAADHFAPLAPYLCNPMVLACPADRAKHSVNSYARFSNTNLSYFISLDASLGPSPNPSFSILTGDRHLSSNNQPVPPGLFATTNFTALGWRPGFHGSSNAPSGVMAFVDGHTENVKSANLPAIFQRQGILTNRLVIP